MARKNPTQLSVPKMDKHEGMLNEMHSALHALGDKIRKPFTSNGDKLLPKKLQSAEHPEAKMAKKHIAKLYDAMCSEKM